jgi:aspartyl-tRNA(Asn)/glutamyl-tRNA(Gln) amidotransferase subunit C
MSINKETLDYVARLARIELTPKELDKLSGQLISILDFIDKLENCDIDNVLPTSHILPINNILREDIPAASLSNDLALECAPQKKGNFFVVPKVIE